MTTRQMSPEEEASLTMLSGACHELLQVMAKYPELEIGGVLWHPKSSGCVTIAGMQVQEPQHFAQVLAATSKILRDDAIRYAKLKEFPKKH